MLRFPPNPSERKQGPGQLERLCLLRRDRSGGRRVELDDRTLVIAPRRQEEPPAPMGKGSERHVGVRRPIVEQRQQPLGRAQVADPDQRLDRDRPRDEGHQRVHLVDVFEQRCDPAPGGTWIVTAELDRSEDPPDAVRLRREVQAFCRAQQIGRRREPGLPSVKFDLAEVHQAERLCELPAHLQVELHRLAAKARRVVPPTCSHLHRRQIEHGPDDVRIIKLELLCDQLAPDRAGLVEMSRDAELEGKVRPRFVRQG